VRGDDGRIADYLLGELPAAERAEVERRIARDSAFAEAVDRMRAVVEGLEAVPSGGWPSDDPSGVPSLPPVPGLERPRRRMRAAPRPALAAAAAVAALAVGVAVGTLVTSGGEDDGPPVGPALTLTPLGDAGPSARCEARFVGTGPGSLRLDVSGLAPLDGGAFYELWLLDSGDRLVSLGSFRVPASGRAEVDVPLPVPVDSFRFLDVSREPDDGNPAHSGDSVLRGPTGTA
jgi:anti-sigma-K factor RskA